MEIFFVYNCIMPIRRRRRGRRVGRRRRRRWGRRPQKYRVSRWGIKKYNIHRFRRMGRTTNVPLQAGTDIATYSPAFNFADVVNNTEFTSLYDQYRIDYVTMMISWSPLNTIALNPNNPGEALYPLMYYCKDYDDATSPLSLTAFKEKGNLRSFRLTPNKVYKIHVKPASQKVIVKQFGLPGANVTFGDLSTGPVWNKKIDCNSDTTPHFGIKMLWNHVNAANGLGAVTVEKMYHFTCFGVR